MKIPLVFKRKQKECKHDLKAIQFYSEVSGKEFGDYGWSAWFYRCEKCNRYFVGDYRFKQEVFMPAPKHEWMKEHYGNTVREMNLREATLATRKFAKLG